MKHPFQNAVATPTHLYLSVQNRIFVFDVGTARLVGSWHDETGGENGENAPKIAKTNAKKKVPKGISGSTPIFNQIRCMQITADGQILAVTTDSDKSAVIFNVDFGADNCLKLLKRQNMPKRPCSISFTGDRSSVLIGDKFGDVYRISLDENVLVEKDMAPILGHVSMLTKVLVCQAEGEQYVLTSDRDEHIKVSRYPKTHIINHWLFGHDEYISDMAAIGADPKVLVSAGGDDSVFLWDWYNNKLLSTYNMRAKLEPYLTQAHYPPERFRTEDSVKEISVVRLLEVSDVVFVALENVRALLLLDVVDQKLQFNAIVELKHPLVDIACYKNTLVALYDTEDDDLIGFFEASDGKLAQDSSKKETIAKIVETNNCQVSSREDFYQLYTSSSLRKRSEH